MIDWPDLILRADRRRSFRDFHAMGLNYACLEWTGHRIVKLYELPDTKGRPLVAPHSHRYEFLQTVLAGRLVNQVFESEPYGPLDHHHHVACTYHTPISGGTGRFQADHFTRLEHVEDHFVSAGGCYTLRTDEIHTLSTDGPTWVVTVQAQDTKTESETFTYFRKGEVPEPDERLYKPMAPADLWEMSRRLKKALKL